MHESRRADEEPRTRWENREPDTSILGGAAGGGKGCPDRSTCRSTPDFRPVLDGLAVFSGHYRNQLIVAIQRLTFFSAARSLRCPQPSELGVAGSSPAGCSRTKAPVAAGAFCCAGWTDPAPAAGPDRSTLSRNASRYNMGNDTGRGSSRSGRLQWPNLSATSAMIPRTWHGSRAGNRRSILVPIVAPQRSTWGSADQASSYGAIHAINHSGTINLRSETTRSSCVLPISQRGCWGRCAS